MKAYKLFTTIILGASLLVAVSCNNNTNTVNTDSTAVEDTMQAVVETPQHNCQDSVCAATNCENCTKKGTPECCKKVAAEQHECEHAKACCEGHEGCQNHQK